MKDEQKSRALQVCAMLVDIYDGDDGYAFLEATLELRTTVELARLVVKKKGRGMGRL